MTCSPWWYVVGLTVDPDIPAARLAEFDAFYRDVHAPEVLRHNPGFTRCLRWQVGRRDPAGEPAPDRLACYAVLDESSVDSYLDPAKPRPAYSPKPDVWRAYTRPLWRGFWRVTGTAGEPATGPIGLTGGHEPPATGRPSARLAVHRDMSQAPAPRHVVLHEAPEQVAGPWRLLLTPLSR
jgi:hypothetical protein